ncbi:MAG TPA: Sir2 family NAD-dependent protein deacetylase [Gemmataceae bacterium]|jgi:NAD-dependent SIR2 family protein deacetylase|nr:Sir2 family NAD-dependent protein deacetylase [Gemmataceae bacterium]
MADDVLVQRAAEVLASADALLIGAGAGMGVDSGLPDFRGAQGFWRAYPPYEKLGLGFSSLANPRWFTADPALAWGFYGHRLNLYRATRPHDGFQLLRSWGQRVRHGAFVFTSNVDGHFQRAGFDPERVVEVHGSIHWMQCLDECGMGLFPADAFQISVDEATMRAEAPLPVCAACGALARPNILMFGDMGWDGVRTTAQAARLDAWLREVGGSRLVIVECGAGTAVPTVRHTSESLAVLRGALLIRINPRESTVPAGHIGLAMGALEGLRTIDGLTH